MRDREQQADEDARSPAVRRPTEGPGPLPLRAALEGRPELLGPAGLRHLQRTVGNSGLGQLLGERDGPPDPVRAVLDSPGQPLDAGVRTDLEQRFGQDFGDVRVHHDAAAHESARTLDAHAYTVGSHLVFQRDAYDPGSRQGFTTLAHELTHVVQQRSGPVDGTPAPGGLSVSDPGDRFEREAVEHAGRLTDEAETEGAIGTPDHRSGDHG
ncbi:DUF4157 domain-containing protein [Kitasatospora paracochleata]|uniref:eCIS core domain-containing protein n=1 Tax=Kitasatospora paracochleata TaxID=58354 RepID=A0ABT1IVJ0_9ACTN|nr:DUF4157 domain-containing protein [Kitasatospora paracochleata]MCP2309142.1 hypothetical protein [Kitasatospora paracochleata]